MIQTPVSKPSIDTLLQEIMIDIGSCLYWRSRLKTGPLAAVMTLLGVAICNRICTGKSRWSVWPDSGVLPQRFPDAHAIRRRLTYANKEKESQICQ